MKELLTLQQLIFELVEGNQQRMETAKQSLKEDLEGAIQSVIKNYPNFVKPTKEEVKALKEILKTMTNEEFHALSMSKTKDGMKAIDVSEDLYKSVNDEYVKVFPGDHTSKHEIAAMMNAKQMIETRKKEMEKKTKQSEAMIPGGSRTTQTLTPDKK